MMLTKNEMIATIQKHAQPDWNDAFINGMIELITKGHITVTSDGKVSLTVAGNTSAVKRIGGGNA